MDKFNIHPLDFVKAKPFQESQCHLVCSDTKALLSMVEKILSQCKLGLLLKYVRMAGFLLRG